MCLGLDRTPLSGGRRRMPTAVSHTSHTPVSQMLSTIKMCQQTRMVSISSGKFYNRGKYQYIFCSRTWWKLLCTTFFPGTFASVVLATELTKTQTSTAPPFALTRMNASWEPTPANQQPNAGTLREATSAIAHTLNSRTLIIAQQVSINLICILFSFNL